MLTRWWFRKVKPAVPARLPVSPAQHHWVLATFPGAWSLQTFDPAVFGREPEWNIWAYAGDHRLSFRADENGLHVSVAVGYRRPGPPVCHLDFPLTNDTEQADFLTWLQRAG